MRVQSNLPLKNGGWLHKDTGPVPIVLRPVTGQSTFSCQQYFDWKGRNNAPLAADRYLDSLGCERRAWQLLGIVWADTYKAWAIPMRDASEQMIGVQLRYLDGSKRAVKGSRNGLFIPTQPAGGFALICEGASDTVAGLTLGYYAIGRHSCGQGSDMLQALLLRKSIKIIAFIIDNDEAGVQGAKRVSAEIKLPSVMVIPPAKDLREFVQEGGTRSILDSMMGQAIWNHQNS